AVDVAHRLPVEGQDHVAALETGAIGRAVRRDVADDGAADLLEADAVGEIRRHRLNDDAELRAADTAVLAQVVHHVLRHVRRNREADADVRVHRRQHLGVDADHFALRVHERAAGVAVVDRPVALTMPIVTVWPTPSGLPIASTTSPICELSELPSGATGRLAAFTFT